MKEGTANTSGRSGTAWIWVVTAGIALAAAALFALSAAGLSPIGSPRHLPWWALALLFFPAETAVVHVEFRTEAHTFSLSEIPLVLGMFFSSPAAVVLAALVGGFVALALVRRQPPLKIAFNLAQFALTTTLAVVLFHQIGGGEPLGPRGWIGVFAAAVAGSLLAALLIGWVIRIADPGRPLRPMIRTGLIGVGGGITSAALGLVSAIVAWHDVRAGWLLAVPATLLFLAYKGYGSERRKNESLDHLYRSTRRLQRSLDLDETLRGLLSEARTMFRAEIAEVLLLPHAEGEQALSTEMGPDGEVRSVAHDTLDPTQGVWARVVAEDRSLALPRPIQNERLRAHFESRGMRDMIVAPLRRDGEVVGILRVANRLGDVGTFASSDLKPLETLATQASVALENARLVTRLEESLIRLQESSRMKDDFIATVSHELRTPLTIVLGFLSTLLRVDGSIDGAQRRDFLEAAERAGVRLRELIEQILLASRIESGHVERSDGPVVLSALARRVVEELEPRREGHRFEVRFPTSMPTIVTDGAKVHRILTNLVDNALKYGEGSVTVSGWAEGGVVTLSVSDQGPGIGEEHHARVFDRFYQADSSSTRAVGGTGLGLYICQRLSEELGGRLWLEGSGVEGTDFRLELPIGEPEGGEVVDIRSAHAG